MKTVVTVILSVLPALAAQAQSDHLTHISFSGYSEIYYSYDFSNPDNHLKPGFLCSHNRHNEVNLNLGYLKASYLKERTRANVAFMAGTYSNANLASEPGVLKNIYEANAGVKIAKQKNLWIDAGIFASHIGFESAHAPSCWTLTRSILADNSPYYESGIRLTHTSSSEKWLLSALVLNGWQRIQRVEGNNTPAFGTQVTYTPGSKVTLNSSTFIGNDKPDTLRQWRYFHNFYGIFKFSDAINATVGFDIGAEEKGKDSSGYNVWYSPVLMLKTILNKRIALAVRGEYYSDINGVIIATGTPNGFQTFGYSLNMDYYILDNVLWRIEGRGFSSRDKIFVLNRKPSSQNYFITTSLAVTF